MSFVIGLLWSLGYRYCFSDNQFKIGQRLLQVMECVSFIAEHLKNQSSEKVAVNDPLINGFYTRFARRIRCITVASKTMNTMRHLKRLRSFFWADFCDNYLELIKDRLFNAQNYDQALIAETQFVLYEVGFGCCNRLHRLFPM